jgi:glucosamine--fructose-6-phosphate aminotransferase (isomerizing)
VELELFLADVERKPATLAGLADRCAGGIDWGIELASVEQVVLLGMGSSRYAAEFCARSLRRRGIPAWSDYSSAFSDHVVDASTLVVLISASGNTPETLAAAEGVRGRGPTLALTNSPASPLESLTNGSIDVAAGVEASGAVTRSMAHTVVVLQALSNALTGGGEISAPDLARRGAEAVAGLLDRRDTWLPQTAELLDGTAGVHFLAPAWRMASAAQSALIVREVPRRPAMACDTTDWPHVDVYLTSSTDYRAVLFGQTAADPEVLRWMTMRESVVVAVGDEIPGVAGVVTYPHADEPLVALLADTVVAELVAHRWASTRPQGG